VSARTARATQRNPVSKKKRKKKKEVAGSMVAGRKTDSAGAVVKILHLT
jgi:hypothetical protein